MITSKVNHKDQDITKFKVECSASDNDKKTLLFLMEIIQSEVKKYVYLETGSYLGGSLFPHVINHNCGAIFSIDKRPDHTADERPVDVTYKGVTSEGMLNIIHAHAHADQTKKIVTLDCDAADVSSSDVMYYVDLAFIDGEHTNVAAFSDFINIEKHLKKDCIVAFHDANLVSDAILNVATYLKSRGIKYRLYFMPDVVAVFALGHFASVCEQMMPAVAHTQLEFLLQSKQRLREDISYAVQNGLHIGRL